ncbi:hypothetical protein SAMN04489761_3137 [Tenacibaculum sp. MAR_2009_124]|uniref:glycosyltransferase n=1 Tax=Tenacibaculum sp. MAR_2009_124 TaxID=1250059 RepID=UPI0008966ADC|nr:glycosyltransferase family 2 protein [Tenacibaculum sp. MAR_2009_124]SEC49051.1 hypothetical protein SAMN04489761_3137 [Tenacibaculum sp. MAR_2009_124]
MDGVRLTCCVVIFNEDINVLKKMIDCFLSIPFAKKMFLIDNSSNQDFTITNTEEIEYIKNKRNVGFGRAHNQILGHIEGKSDYHLVLNPDVEFDGVIFQKLISSLENDDKITMISPKVLNSDGSLQFTCRKNPTVKEMISRRLGINKDYVKEREYRDIDLNKSFTPEFIHGCFMLFKTKDFVALGGFDSRYFLYLEDADLCREIRKSNRKLLYFPDVHIKHLHRKGSSKRIKLLFYHIASAYKYFKKWKK